MRYARDCVERAELEGWAAGWNALHTMDIADGLSAIRIPTRIIAGGADASTPPKLMNGMRAIPDSALKVIPDAPHMLSLTHPAELAEMLMPSTG